MSTAAGATRRAVSMPDEPMMTSVPTPSLQEEVLGGGQVEDVPVAQPEQPTPQENQAADAPVAELGPNDQIWDGGPTMAQVDAWKEQHGAGNIYVTAITPEVNVIWRTLTRFEYRRLVKNLEQSVATGTISQTEANLNNEEQVTELCVLYPPLNRQAMSGELAGLPSLISQEVMQASGFEALEVRQL